LHLQRPKFTLNFVFIKPTLLSTPEKPKKQIDMFDENTDQLKISFEGQFAAWSLKVQKITEVLQRDNLSPDNRQMWLKELHYYQDLLRTSNKKE
jgi:hypothetical protein